MINRYLNTSIIVDLLICLVALIGMYFIKPYVKGYCLIPTVDKADGFCSLLITIGTTFIGFFLTVITVIVTFKNAFDGQRQPAQEPNPEAGITIFDKKISKEHQFYDTDLYKQVLSVFIKATYEIGMTMFVLLLLQTHLLTLRYYWFIAVI